MKFDKSPKEGDCHLPTAFIQIFDRRTELKSLLATAKKLSKLEGRAGKGGIYKMETIKNQPEGNAPANPDRLLTKLLAERKFINKYDLIDDERYLQMMINSIDYLNKEEKNEVVQPNACSLAYENEYPFLFCLPEEESKKLAENMNEQYDLVQKNISRDTIWQKTINALKSFLGRK